LQVRGALTKLNDLAMAGKHAEGELTHWYKTVEDTKWLYLLRVLLLGCINTASEMLKVGRPISSFACVEIACLLTLTFVITFTESSLSRHSLFGWLGPNITTVSHRSGLYREALDGNSAP